MSAIKAILSWVFRKLILFALIVAAMIAHAVWSQGRNAERAQTSNIASEISSIDVTKNEAVKVRKEAETTANAASIKLKEYQESMRGASIDTLKRERARTEKEIAHVRKTLPTKDKVLRQVLARDTEALKKSALNEINLARLERQLAFLNESIAIARGNRSTLVLIEELKSQFVNTKKTLQQHEQKCSIAAKNLQAFDEKRFVERLIPRVLGERRDLVAVKAAACGARAKARATQQQLKNRMTKFGNALEYGAATIDTAVAANLEALQGLELQSEARQAHLKAQRDAASKGLGVLADRFELASKALSALWWLLAIIITPFLIRILFYYVLAPLAERRASIRVNVPGNEGTPLPPSEPSRISLPVTLAAGEELLIRQDYLQTSPTEAEKATRWLLDYCHPLSSMASGLFFLTRLRGRGSTTVSAVKDSFAELARIDLPQGASCVLHPRALVALVQPIGQTMQITSHWRLLSLNAWLTMQLRFIVFHGPGCLVVRGGRGVRVEPAAAGRIFGQDQLVGFSADLAYSVTRTETFAPYLFGREQLFKDKVEQGAGVLIIEEAPLAGRNGGEVRRGLEGVFDAGLKALGL